MKGLPRLPTDFVTLDVLWVINDGWCTTSWNIFNPGSSSANAGDLASFVAQWFLLCLPDLLAVLGTDVTASACRATATGSTPLVYRESFAPNAGAVGTTNPLNGCLCLTWRTNETGIGGRSHTLLPLSDTFVDTNHSTLQGISWSQAQSAATLYLNHVNGLTSVDGGSCVLAVVHRSRNGTPLPSAIWAPVLVGDASPRVGTVARRTRAPRRISPF